MKALGRARAHTAFGASAALIALATPLASCGGGGAAASTGTATARPARLSGRLEIRVNQVGYVAASPKQALVMSRVPLGAASFELPNASGGQVVLRGRLSPSRGAFNASWRYVYAADFTGLRRPGTYLVAVSGARSQPVVIGDGMALYGPLAQNAVTFFQAQRDGPQTIPGALGRVPSHLRDARARVYATPRYNDTNLLGHLTPTGQVVDASGGWFDAGDYMKFVETASFSDSMLLFTLRDFSAGLSDPSALRAEARFGTDWLLKMWDQSRGVLYSQVGLGDGNDNSILGDHDLWRLPQADDRANPRPGSPTYYTSHRPVFAANAPGHPISPNLAGRVAAAFGLCAQVFAATDPAYARRCLLAGQTIYALADTHPRGTLTTTVPPAYYVEQFWRDDMELGATELYLATARLGGAGMPQPNPFTYVGLAGHWADAYISAPGEGRDSLNLYDVSAVAHYDLAHVLSSPAYLAYQQLSSTDLNVTTDPGSLTRDLHDGLALALHLSRRDPFGLANPAQPTDTVPHALGYAIDASLYDRLTHSTTFASLAATQLGWVLGANPWGSSLIVGAGRTFPRCLAGQVANLSGSLNGSGRIMLGATVDGPNALNNLTGLGAPDGFRRCPASARDPYAALTGHGAGYIDDVRSPSTSEPSDDYAALALLATALQATGG